MSTQHKSTLIERLDALYEYEREPVDEKKLYGWKTFIAMFSGEHIGMADITIFRYAKKWTQGFASWRRWKVTFAAGVFMIVTACIPAVNAKLNRIVGYYGLFFMPLGALIFIDIWVFPKLGLISDYAQKARLMISWPATFAWIGAFLFSVFLYGKDHYGWLSRLLEGRQPAWRAGYKPDLMFLAAPEWIVAVTLYMIFSVIQQKVVGTRIQTQEAA